MPLTTAAGALATVTTRLRRAGRVPAPVALPSALTGTRLTPLADPPDVDTTVTLALDRLADSRGESAASPPSTDTSRTTPLPYAVSRASGRVRGPVAAPSQALPALAVPVAASGAGASLRPGSPEALAGRTAPAAPTAFPEQAPPTGAARTGEPTRDLIAATSAGAARTAVTAATATRRPARAGATAVRVPTDPATAALLDALVRAATGAPVAAGAAAPATRPARPTRPTMPADADPALAAPSPDPTPRPLPSATGTARAASTRPPHDEPAAAPFADAVDAPRPRTPARDGSDGLPGGAPVGLAGLVGWWNDHAEPGVGDDHGGTARGWGPGEPAYGPRGFEPWSTPDVATAEQLRDALAQVLLEEALADGLEVTDGPAPS